MADQDEDKEDNTYRRPEFPANTRRDPFTFRAPEPEVRDEQQARQREPLEAFETNQLRLVAIVTGTAVPEAMFTDPTGFGHFAKEDDRIGRNGGRITDIRENEVEITINPEANLGSDSDIEDEDEDERPPAEPITLIIRLSDTELKLPGSDEAENEEPSILEKIDETPEGSQDGNPPLSP